MYGRIFVYICVYEHVLNVFMYICIFISSCVNIYMNISSSVCMCKDIFGRDIHPCSCVHMPICIFSHCEYAYVYSLLRAHVYVFGQFLHCV